MQKMCLIIAGVCSLVLGNLPAEEATQVEECTKELLLSYYPAPLVKKTLGKFKVSENQWDEIVSSLESRDKDVIRMVEEKAEKMTPNPLQDPRQRQVAVEIFHERLLDIFSSVLNAHGVADPAQIQAMLDDIKDQRIARFAQCIETYHTETDEVEVEESPAVEQEEKDFNQEEEDFLDFNNEDS